MTDTDTESDTDDTDSTDHEHTRDILSLDEGDEVTLTMDDGSTIDATFVEKRTHHNDSGPHISEQKMVEFETSDGDRIEAGITNGLSGIEDTDPFPSFFPLHEVDWDGDGPQIPDEAILGYIQQVDQR